jgi:murein DD-endopeptidase MepM/ murein hydrolase activator NlpD
MIRSRNRSRLGKVERLESRCLLAMDGFDFEDHLSHVSDSETFGFAEMLNEEDHLEEDHLHEHEHEHEHALGPAALMRVSEGNGTIELSKEGQGLPTRSLGPNLVANSAHLRNGAGNAIASPFVGELVAVQVNYSTESLLASASYRIHFIVDGVLLESAQTTAGAGVGNGNYFWWRSGWYATPGNHTVTVQLDGYNTVAETNETDNAITFSFSTISATLPQKLAWPIDGEPFSDVNFTNYVDLDPTAGIRDYQNGIASYDGHDAWDIGPWNFQAQDAGIRLYAAADGIVTAVNDGAYDRQTAWLSPAPQANYVIVDHGSGWTTIYWHLRRDSVHVRVGDSVQAGDVLGWMGSSGISTGSHIHFGLRHFGFPVEPMLDPSSYLLFNLPYVQNALGILNHGITNYNPNAHNQERPSDVGVFRQTSGQTVFVWGAFAGLDSGDVLEYVWRRPSGTVYTTTTTTMSQSYRSSWWWWSRNLPTVPDLGTWTIDFRVNGNVLDTGSFVVTSSGAPEIRVEDSAAAIILDGRITPLAFQATATGTSAPPMTFTVRNHGQTTLNVSSLQVPTGFTIVEGLSPQIVAGSSDTFTLTTDSSFDGFRSGRVRILSDDADESEYDFAVEGNIVEGNGTSSEVPTLAVGIGNPILREGRLSVANVRRNGNTTQPLVVSLSPFTSRLSMPTTVTIPAGQSWINFFVEGLTNTLSDPDAWLGFLATAVGYNSGTIEFKLVDSSLILDRRTFYNRSTSSVFGNGTGNPSSAIDPTKAALLPGQMATINNYTNYIHGLNGIVIDMASLPSTPTAADFRFDVWNGIAASGFIPATAVPTITRIVGGGLLGSDRMKIEFDNGSIRNTWLRVTMLANAVTGLPNDDIFYFGSAVGDMYLGNIGTPTTVRVNATDTSSVRQNQSPGANSVAISNAYDLNKDGRVNASDTSMVRQSQSGEVIRFFTSPPGPNRFNTTPKVSDSFLAADQVDAVFELDASYRSTPVDPHHLDGVDGYSTWDARRARRSEWLRKA